jgi:hypothetical protein
MLGGGGSRSGELASAMIQRSSTSRCGSGHVSCLVGSMEPVVGSMSCSREGVGGTRDRFGTLHCTRALVGHLAER